MLMAETTDRVDVEAPRRLARVTSEFGAPGTLKLTTLLAAGVLVSATLPVLGAFATLMMLAVCSRSRSLAGAASVTAIVIPLALLNTSKSVSGDWSWYTELYSEMNSGSMNEFLGTRFGPGLISIKSTEPLYYYASDVLSSATNGSIPALSASITITIYLLIGFSLTLLGQHIEVASSKIYLCLIPALLVGVTFTLTTQLVRQELALALLVLAIALTLQRRYLLTAVIVAAAVLVQNSAAIPSAAIFIGTLLLASQRPKVALMCATLGFAGLGFAYSRSSGAAGYLTQDNGSVSILVLGFDALLIFTLWRVGRGNSWQRVREASSLIATIYVLLIIFLVFIISLPVPFLRIYLYIEALRVLAIFMLTYLLVTAERAWSYPVLIILTGIYFQLRLSAAPWEYSYGTLIDVLLLSPYGIGVSP